MQLRKWVFWLHLPVGVTAGLVVLAMSVSGVLLAYERQITAWVDRDYRVLPQAQATRLPIETLLARSAETQTDARPSTVTVRADPSAAVVVGYGRERVLYVDPYSGAVLGEGSRGVRTFFQSVNGWHRWLAMSGASRTLGRGITGASNLAFLFLVVSGVYLWWPRTWTTRTVRAVTLFERRPAGRARDFNWHNVFGFWSALPLVFIVSSGVVMSYPWANDLLYHLTGSEPPPARGADQAGSAGASERRGDGSRGAAGRGREHNPSEGQRRERDAGTTVLELDGLDRLWATAEQRVAGWRSIGLRLPPAGGPLTFTIDTGEGGRPDQRSQLTLDRATGEVLRWEPFASYNLGRQVRSWGRFVHTGEAGGVLGQTLAALASTGGAMLVWTGLSLAWRRFLAWKRRAPSHGLSPAPAALDAAGAQLSAGPGFLTQHDADKSA